MNILVTGGHGFIGQYLMETLNQRGHLAVPGSRINCPGCLKIDAFQPQQTLKLLEEFKFEVVINLAWHTSGVDYFKSPANIDALDWNRKFFKIIRDSTIRKIVSVGSSAEYLVRGTSIDFSNSLDSLYAQSKVNAYRSFVETFKSTKISFVWLRLFQIYGPGQSSHRFIPALSDHIRRKKLLTVTNPNQLRDWIDVRDVAESIAIISEQSEDREIDLGTSHGLTNTQICEYAHERFGLGWAFTPESYGKESPDLVADPQSPLFKYFAPKRNLFEYLDSSLS